MAVIPWLVYFTVTLIRVPPPIMPRTFRRVLLFITSWYAAGTTLLAIAAVANLIPMNLPGPSSRALANHATAS
jgi:hypothetical protein